MSVILLIPVIILASGDGFFVLGVTGARDAFLKSDEHAEMQFQLSASNQGSGGQFGNDNLAGSSQQNASEGDKWITRRRRGPQVHVARSLLAAAYFEHGMDTACPKCTNFWHYKEHSDLTNPVVPVWQGSFGQKVKNLFDALGRFDWPLVEYGPSLQLAMDALEMGLDEADYDAYKLLRTENEGKFTKRPLTAHRRTYWGSKNQYLYGRTVHEVLVSHGHDAPHPIMCALLNPTGGILGSANGMTVIDWWTEMTGGTLQDFTIMHGISHDAFGYCFRCHQVGPGYTYIYEDTISRDSKRGQVSGLFEGRSVVNLIDGDPDCDDYYKFISNDKCLDG